MTPFIGSRKEKMAALEDVDNDMDEDCKIMLKPLHRSQISEPPQTSGSGPNRDISKLPFLKFSCAFAGKNDYYITF